jgi:hypothetical protein
VGGDTRSGEMTVVREFEDLRKIERRSHARQHERNSAAKEW